MKVKCGRPAKGCESLSRDRVLDSALKLFLEHGYGQLNMDAIARDAHVSLRTIYGQFGGKAGLFGALIRRCSDQFADTLTPDAGPESALTAFAKDFLFRISRPDVVRMRAILIGEALQFPDLATQFYQQGPQNTLTRLTQFFAWHQQKGLFSAWQPDFLADRFLSMLRSEHLQKLQLGLEATPTEADIANWVTPTIKLFLQGCGQGGKAL